MTNYFLCQNVARTLNLLIAAWYIIGYCLKIGLVMRMCVARHLDKKVVLCVTVLLIYLVYKVPFHWLYSNCNGSNVYH